MSLSHLHSSPNLPTIGIGGGGGQFWEERTDSFCPTEAGDVVVVLSQEQRERTQMVRTRKKKEERPLMGENSLLFWAKCTLFLGLAIVLLSRGRIVSFQGSKNLEEEEKKIF